MKLKMFLIILTILLTTKIVYSQWELVNGPMIPGGTSIYAFAAVPNENGGKNLYFGSAGVFISTDNGTHWSPINNGLYDLPVTSLSFVDEYIYAGTHNSGVFRSTDFGKNWVAENSGLTNLSIRDFTSIGSDIYSLTHGGLFLSKNYGITWSNFGKNLTNQNILSFLVRDTTFWVVNDCGIFFSSDGGNSWTLKNTGIPENVTVFLIRGVDSILFAGTNDGVYRSTNNGNSWNAVNTGLPYNYIQDLIIIPDDNGGMNMIASELDGGLGVKDGVFFSSDYGDHWMSNTIGNIYKFTYDGSNLYATGRGCMLSTDKGRTWSDIGPQQNYAQINCLTSSGNNLYAGVRGSGIFTSSNNGDTWVKINNGISDLYMSWIGTLGGVIYIGTDHTVFRSSDNGASWIEYHNGLPNTPFYYSICNSNLFVCTAIGIFSLNVDSGIWIEKSNGLDFSKGVRRMVSIGSTLFVATYFGIYSSTNNGESWNAINIESYAQNVEEFRANGTDLYIWSNEYGAYRSTDLGTSWSQININANYISNMITVGSNLFSAAGWDIFLSTDNGSTWNTTTSAGFPQAVLCLAVIMPNGESSGFLFVGTTAGIWRRKLSEMIKTNVNDYNMQTSCFSLEQNYPNPFNPATVISYKLKVKSEVVLKIYDILGREIASLVNEQKSAGTHSIEWDGKNSAGRQVGSGIYFYKIDAGSFSETKKMLLLR